MIGTFLLARSGLRQEPAHSPMGCAIRFVSGENGCRFPMRAASPNNTFARDSKNRYPSPSTRLDLPQVGPQFSCHRRRIASCGHRTDRILYVFAGGGMLSERHVTKGNTPCADPYRSSHSLRSLASPPAATRLANRPLSVPALAPEPRSSLIRIRLRARPSAAARTCFTARTIRGRADAPALTGPHARIAAQTDAGSATRGAGVFVMSDRPQRPRRESPCSRRS